MTPEQTIREMDALGRRLDGVDARISFLDEHGSRGLSVLTIQLSELSKDIGTLEAELRRVRSGRWFSVLAFVSALLPVYVFIADQLIMR